MRFFVDHCMPDSGSRVLADAGYEVIRLRNKLPPDSPDPIVAKTAQELGAILVTRDKDFGGKSYAYLNRVTLRCPVLAIEQRIGDALSLIDHEWQRVAGVDGARIAIEITQTGIKTLR